MPGSCLKEYRSIQTLDLIKRAAQLAEDKKAEDIVIYDLTGICSFADYFFICSGDNRIQVNAIAEEIVKELKKEEVRAHHKEGGSESEWILLDYNQVVMHIFTHDMRKFFALDTIWGDAPRVEW